MAWNWNYFTLESMCKAKCSLCDQYERPTIHIDEFLYHHIQSGSDTPHKIAFELIKNFDIYSKIDWDNHYRTVQSIRNMFNPEVICKCCKNVMPVQDMEIRKQEFIKASPEMTLHLKERHGVDYDNWMSLKSWLVNHAGDYCKVPKLGVIYKCKKCEIPFKNGIMFVKHLFDKHRCDGKLDKFPWINIPNELRSLYSTVREDTTLSSDIADRSGSSSQGRSGVSSESTQFSRKRKEEVLKKMSETLEEVVKKMSEMPEISTQIEEPLYKRRKYSSTDNSD